MSATLSDTGPTPAIPETAALTTAAVPGPSASGTLSPASPSPLAKRAKPTKESRPHVIAFDLIRLIIMVFVVSVHTLAFGGGQVTVVLGAFTTVFHTSRELFFLLTALVLTYNYGHRRNVRWLAFWRRRYWLVVPAYVAWSAIYFAADGHWPGSPAPSRPLSGMTCSPRAPATTCTSCWSRCRSTCCSRCCAGCCARRKAITSRCSSPRACTSSR